MSVLEGAVTKVGRARLSRGSKGCVKGPWTLLEGVCLFWGPDEMKHSFTATPSARKVHFMMIITFWPGCVLH